MKIVTAAEMREIDRLTTAHYGVSSLTLMENAGAAVAEFAQKHFDFDSACVVCGKGNNGGDGFVAARKLKEAGKQVSVIILVGSREELRGDAADMFHKLPVTPLWASEEADFKKAEVQQALHADLIVDAILGTGFSPPLKGIAARAVEVINQCRAPVVAVDVPSGTDADATSPLKGDLAIQADAVITFTAPKPAHVFGELTRGAMAVSEIGTPPQCVFLNSQLKQQVMVAPLVADVFPRRRSESHKGDFGHVLVIGGSLGKAGAAGMAGMAALHSGAGLVTVASPESVQPTVAAIAPELMTEALAETEEGSLSMQAIPPIEQLRKGKDTIVLGPGLSRNRETAEAVRQLLPIFRGGVTVLDADGLNAFEHHAGQLHTEGILVLTPHPGEMSRISGLSTEEVQKDRIGTAREMAKKHQAVVVLKGHRTVTAAADGEVWINCSGNAGMAKGGSGDVLSGIIAVSTRMRQQGSYFTPMGPETLEWFALLAAAGVYLHGLAGDVARDLFGEYSMTATDIIKCLPEAFAICRREATEKFVYLQR